MTIATFVISGLSIAISLASAYGARRMRLAQERANRGDLK